MKYTELQADIFSVFDSAAWKAENINTYPSNFVGMNTTNEFIRVTIIPSGQGINLPSISGLILIDIFSSAGDGPQRPYAIADVLDSYLVGKTFKTGLGSTQLTNSSLDERGRDPDNDILYRTIYSIPFNFYGVV